MTSLKSPTAPIPTIRTRPRPIGEPPAMPAPPARQKFAVNRTVPSVQAPPASPAFSEAATDEEIFRARVFAEPLVPIGKTAPSENKALALALRAFLQRS